MLYPCVRKACFGLVARPLVAVSRVRRVPFAVRIVVAPLLSVGAVADLRDYRADVVRPLDHRAHVMQVEVPQFGTAKVLGEGRRQVIPRITARQHSDLRHITD